ncbi:MAG: 2-oxoacid:acceptor oxidoreductase family protein [Clostridiales bacterium]|jgi:2-oxoglutarate ferredoxin oxidoreductase subunit gamma|nr:2-oxoacid:acceptor oxidoreductase family protein [Clostridiales bacterium]
MTRNMLIAGFGGQGILFAGKFIAYTALLRGKEVSWLPSYGPEMRGGTANCSVIISDEPVGSPIVLCPDILTALNLPSLDKYEEACAPGAEIFINSTLINRKGVRAGARFHYIPATKLADDAGIPKLANMVMVGAMIKRAEVCAWEDASGAMKKTVPERKKELFDANLRALEIGYNFDGSAVL